MVFRQARRPNQHAGEWGEEQARRNNFVNTDSPRIARNFFLHKK
jgi:hypothetical protein